MNKTELAIELFTGGFNCATSVLLSFCEEYGLEPETAAKLACGLGGGCVVGEICGAASGAVLVIGLKHGQSTYDDLAAKTDCYEKTKQLTESFAERNGYLTCRELLEHNNVAEKTPEIAPLKKAFCTGVVKNAVEILEQLGY